MTDKELVMTIARDLLVEMMDNKKCNLNISLRGGDDAVIDLGKRLDLLASKIQETLDRLNVQSTAPTGE